MDRVTRKQAGGRNHHRAIRKCRRHVTAIIRHLPLVITDHAELNELAHVFAQGQRLAEPPFISEGLTRRFVRPVDALLLAVDFPVGEETRTGTFVFGEVNRRPRRHVIAKVAGPNIV